MRLQAAVGVRVTAEEGCGVRPPRLNRSRWADSGSTRLRRILAIVMLIALVQVVQAWAMQISSVPKDPELTIKGVGLGTELARIRQLLGEPRTQLDEPPDGTMGMGPTKTLKYDGLLLELCKPDGHAEFYVWSIVVTGKQWSVEPGLRVEISRAAVVRVLGPPEHTSRDAATSRETLGYSYKRFDGYYGVTLEKGRVVEISAGEDWS